MRSWAPLLSKSFYLYLYFINKINKTIPIIYFINKISNTKPYLPMRSCAPLLSKSFYLYLYFINKINKTIPIIYFINKISNTKPYLPIRSWAPLLSKSITSNDIDVPITRSMKDWNQRTQLVVWPQGFYIFQYIHGFVIWNIGLGLTLLFLYKFPPLEG